MKKLFTLVAVASISLVACGPSAAEKEAAEKAKQDSIKAYEEAEAAAKAAEEQRIADSVKAFEDAKAAEEKRVADSIEAAKSKKGKK
jgi:hypothetical protein